MLVPYECCSKQFEDFYTDQAGNGLTFYAGQPFQKGYGIGGWFKKLFRTALPFLSRGAKSVGKEVLKAGTQIAGDILEGRNFEESAKQHTKDVGKKLARKAIQKVDDMLGRGKQYKRKKKTKKQFISNKVRRVKGRDIFDP